MIIVPSNVSSVVTDPNWRDTSLMLKTIATPGATNSAFYDDGPNKFVPTRVGDVTQGALSPYIPSGYWSAYFDGSGDYLTAGAAASNLGSGPFTVEAWVNPTARTRAYPAVYSNYSSYSSGSLAIFAGHSSGNTSRYQVSVNGAGFPTIQSTDSIVYGQWTHLAVVRDSSNVITLYVNGVANGTYTTSATLNGPGSTGWIGTSGDAVTDSCFHGHISNLRVVPGTAVYTANFTPPTAPLTAITNTSLLALQDNRFRDRSTNNLTLTRNGDTSVSRFAPFGVQVPVTTNLASTGSVTFDGTGDRMSATVPGAAFGTGAFTVECWANVSSFYNYANMVGTRPSNATQASTWGLGAQGDSTVYFYSNGWLLTSPALQRSRWYHIVVVRNASSFSAMFVNGIRVATATITNNFTANLVGIGDFPTSPSEPFNGNLSNIRLVSGTAVYDPTQTTLTVPTSPLTAISGTSLLTAQDAVNVTDASTNNYTVTRFGDAKAVEVSPFKRVTAQYGGSAYFDGTGDILSIPNEAANITNQNFTAETWVWFNTNSIGYQPILMQSGSGDQQGWIIYIESNNTLTFTSSTNGSNWTNGINTSYVPITNSWTHVAAVRNGSTITLYANGVALGTNNIGTAAINSPVGAFYPGYYPFFPGGARSLNGLLSNVRVVIGNAVYTAAFTPPTAPVTAISGTSLLLNFDNAGIWDAAGGMTLSTTTSAAVSNTAAKYGSDSVYLPGTSHYVATRPASMFYNVSGSAFTVECWFRPENINAGGRTILSQRIDTSIAGGYHSQFLIGHDGANLYWLSENSSRSNWAFVKTLTNANVTAGAWHHLALVGDRVTQTLYLNGTALDTAAQTAWESVTPRNIYIGGDVSTMFQGHIDEVRFTRAARYTANFTAPTAAFPTQ